MSERQPGNESTSFGYWVKRRRLALDLTQAALARKVACAVVTIKKIEYDERRPSRQMAESLADALAVSDAERDHFIAGALGRRAAYRMPLDRTPVVEEPPPPRLAPAEEIAFVGRDEELVTLQVHLEATLEGHGRIVLVDGEAGRGKTALLRRFAELAQEASDQLVVAHGYCAAVAGLGDPYLPFRDILLTLLGDLERRGQSGPLLPGQMERLWAVAPEVADMMRRAAPSLVDTLVPASSLDRWHGPDATAGAEGEKIDREPLFEQLTTLLHTLAHEHPLLLVIDDLQWADAASVSLLFHLGRRLDGSKILIAGALRPSEVEVAPGGEPGHTLRQAILEFERLYGAITLDLEQFDMSRARQLSDGLLDCEPNRLRESFRVQLFRRTRGHPLFVVELLHEMRQRGQLVRDEDGLWIEGEPVEWEALPTRVSAVIEQRLSRLDADDRRLLEAAALEGERFTAELLSMVTGGDEVERRLRTLARRHGLVRPLGSIQAGEQAFSRYQFSHVMFQQYLSESLDEGERRILHGRIATTIELLYGDQIEPVLTSLAHHYCQAGDAERAVEYLIRAGDHAHRLYAQQEAADHYSRAIGFLRARGDREAIAHTLMKLGLTHQNAFDYDRAQRAFDEAFVLWPQAARRTVPSSPARPQAPHPLRLIWNDPPALDPIMGGYNLTAPVATQLFSGLVDFGPKSEIVPDVARRWEILDGGRCYRFQLRDDVHWSDGEPVTAQDFAFTYHRALDPATATPVAGRLLHPVKGARDYNLGEHDDPERVGIRALDDRTLEIELEAPTSYFVHNLAYYVSLPNPRHVVLEHGDKWATPENIVTNGPFRLASWQRGDAMVLERDPTFHGTFTGNLECVRLALGVPFEAQLAMYEANELDIVSTWFGRLEDIITLHRRFPDEYSRRHVFSTFYYRLDPARPPFTDRRVRQALVQALDRSLLADVEFEGYADAVTGGMVPPGMPGHVADLARPFDPDMARQRLAAAGFAGGEGFPELLIAAVGSGRLPARFLKRSWEAALGIRCQLREVAGYEELMSLATDPSPIVLVVGWWADYPDPDTFLRVNLEMEPLRWTDTGYWSVIEQASRSVDQGARLALYRRAEQILAEDAPQVPLAHPGLHHMIKPWVKRYPTIEVKYPGFWKDVLIESH